MLCTKLVPKVRWTKRKILSPPILSSMNESKTRDNILMCNLDTITPKVIT